MVDDPLLRGDEREEFSTRPHETVASVLAFYEEECARSRAITASAASLDELAANRRFPESRISLRWILVHMIEETARHAGHADLIRETLDGRVGD